MLRCTVKIYLKPTRGNGDGEGVETRSYCRSQLQIEIRNSRTGGQALTDCVNPSCVIFCAHALPWIKPQADFQQCRTSFFKDYGMREGVNTQHLLLLTPPPPPTPISPFPLALNMLKFTLAFYLITNTLKEACSPAGWLCSVIKIRIVQSDTQFLKQNRIYWSKRRGAFQILHASSAALIRWAALI